MKRILIILLFPFVLNAQENKTDALHFYGSLALNLTAYNAQRVFIPKQKIHWRFINSFVFTSAVGFAKEYYDLHKTKQPLEFKRLNLSDLIIDHMGNFCAFEIQVVFNNEKRKKGFIDYWN